MKAGDAVVWRKEYRGGYGFTHSIPATVERIGPTRICIRVSRTDGASVLRWVTRERLQVREAG